jgi:undecaprenyl pyrophosphate phosphatase UppP
LQFDWNLGKHWKWIAPLAVLEVAIVSIYFILPATPSAIPFRKGFTWASFNYTPVAVIVIIGGALLWWFAGAKNTFKGPVRTLDT